MPATADTPFSDYEEAIFIQVMRCQQNIDKDTFMGKTVAMEQKSI
ncbi:hypothetical protein [Rhizobium sullae]|uniref:Uncharacterized protein n=1 Tax=Rhizobium sullae TaxID=50338 RepID=A0ABY5XX39_RHISU|nr:hypothetical protein [Rhizobium sullae]UWU19205.1 hypothetical protein N2599_36005 [Rhizobium sullae]